MRLSNPSIPKLINVENTLDILRADLNIPSHDWELKLQGRKYSYCFRISLMVRMIIIKKWAFNSMHMYALEVMYTGCTTIH